ncbi:MAG: TIGR02281 family clan AA aspartic protease [Halioglobus sp.]|nr:TIGR02281 family clan AA aspartic protease [Halioglobus sp.]
MNKIYYTIAIVLFLLAGPASAATVEVQAILGDNAVLKVGGERKMMRPGESHGGVTLVRTTASTVVIRINGAEQALGLSQRVGTSYAAPLERVVTIPRNSRDQYLTTALINGRSTPVMVDTGANIVAMSANHARALGIDPQEGSLGPVETAGGVLTARHIKLQSVSVGGIRVDNVDATVVESDYPVTVLLGMSYLRHVKIEEQNGILSLSRTE